MDRNNKTSYSASAYDRGVRQTLPYYDLFHRETLDLVRTLKPNVGLWLDSGCGTGTLVREALGKFPAAEFILADPSDQMLMIAEGKVARRGKGRVGVLPPTDTEGLAAVIGKRKPEVITAIQSHHYLKAEDRFRAVRACRNLLAPKGLLVVFENIAPDTHEGKRIGLRRWRDFQVGQGKSPSQAEKHLGRYGKEFFPITLQAHANLLRKAGFRIVENFWRSHLQAGFYAIK